MDNLEKCINNGNYEEIKKFKPSDWTEELLNKLIDMIKQDITILSKIGYTYYVYNSSELLEFLLRKKEYIEELNSFNDKAWTKENIYLFISVYDEMKKKNNGQAIKVPGGLKRNPNVLNFYLKHEEAIGTEYFTSDMAWTEENKKLFIEILKKRDDIELSSDWKYQQGLKTILEHNLLNYALKCSYPREWTEENISLFCSKLANYNQKLNNSDFPSAFENNSKVLLVMIKTKNYQILQKFKKDAWTEECFDEFSNVIEEYLERGYSIPYYSKTSKKVVIKILNSGYFIDGLDEKLFEDETCANALLNLVPKSFEQISKERIDFQRGKIKDIIKKSPSILKEYISNKSFAVTHFEATAWTEECVDVLINHLSNSSEYVKNMIINQQYEILIKSSKVLKAYLLNERLFDYQIIRYFKDEAWSEECIDLLIPFITKSFADARMIITGNERLLKSPKILKHHLMNKITFLSTTKEDAWTDENINILANSSSDYINDNQVLSLWKNQKFLKAILKNEHYQFLNHFEKVVYNKDIIDEIIELYKLKKIDNVPYKIKEMPYVAYRIIYLDNKKTEIPSSIIINDNIIREFINKKKLIDYKLIYNIGLYLTNNDCIFLTSSQKEFFIFVYKTKSEKILMLIRDLIEDDINKLDLIFQNGLTTYSKEYLIYDYDFITYCIENNLAIENNNPIYQQYLKHTILYSNLHNNIIIDNSNIEKYFNANGIKKELLENLFNVHSYKFLYELLQSEPNLQFEEKKKYILQKCFKIQNDKLKKIFFEFTYEHYDEIDYEKIDNLIDVLRRIEYSNSNEIRAFQEIIAIEVLKFEDPEEKLKQIEEIFIKNNIPTVGKIYSVFKLLHPTYNNFNMKYNSQISPTLKISSSRTKDIIIFSDLIKISLGSNNRSFNNYLDSLVDGNKIYTDIINEIKTYEQLSEEEKLTLDIFFKHLKTLYENSLLSNNEKYNSKEEPISDLNELKRLLLPKNNSSELPDRIVRMFCHFAGFDTIEAIKTYRNNKLKERDNIHRNMAKNPFKLEKGDFIKGIGSINYLHNIFQNGSLAKEFLGESANSDATPLDTDLSIIQEDSLSIREAIDKTEAKGYGNIFFVLKGGARFTHTRNTEKNETPSNYTNQKIEVFYTGTAGKSHYGIRTGFASSEIDYIISDSYYERIGFELALNGMYIPIVDRDGNLKFTPEEYDNIRNKMAGLKFYDNESYTLSEELKTDDLTDVIEGLKNTKEETEYKRNCIVSAIKEALSTLDIGLKTSMDGDLTENIVELLDTGSTGRGTNIPGDGDFDFIMRVDRSIMLDEEKLNAIKKTILKKFNRNSNESGEFRLTDITVPGLEQLVDIDITFITKTNKTEYATENCIQDRLATIKHLSKDDYLHVIANIIKAKEILKAGECYKARQQNGLGGVGVENWILQNGGSLLSAAKSFLECANKCSSLKEFQRLYPIYDFGINHMADKRGHYPYDNYILNLDSTSYSKMKQVLNEYITKLENKNNKKR